MKKKFAYFAMSFSLFLSLAVTPASALAQDESTDDSSALTTTSTSDDSSGRPARVEAYKKALKETITAAAKLRIAERCVEAQKVVKVKKAKNVVAITARTKAYDTIVTRLTALSTAAAAKDADVTVLNANITELKAKIFTLKTASTTFQQSVTDLSAIDCKTDPIAFKASLETARTNQMAVSNAATAIRTYLKDTVKPTLKALKAALESTDN